MKYNSKFKHFIIFVAVDTGLVPVTKVLTCRHWCRSMFHCSVKYSPPRDIEKREVWWIELVDLSIVSATPFRLECRMSGSELYGNGVLHEPIRLDMSHSFWYWMLIRKLLVSISLGEEVCGCRCWLR